LRLVGTHYERSVIPINANLVPELPHQSELAAHSSSAKWALQIGHFKLWS
jgi:hypothetical protein